MKIHPSNHRYISDQNGQTFIPVGHNICWPRWEQDEPTVYSQYESYFRKMYENGANYTRIWLSASFFEPEYEFGKFDNSKGERGRTIQDLARQYGIKIKFCFCHYRQIQESSLEFPGSVSFGMPVWHEANGGCALMLGDYLISKAGKEDFIKRVKFWKKHLANDETVFAWELWNEMDCVNAVTSVWHKWTREMLEEVRRIFPGKMITQSVGGYESMNQRETHEPVWQMLENDLLQVHLYSNPDAQVGNVRRKPMDEMLFDTIHKVNYSANDRPLLFAETGAASFKHNAGPSDVYFLDPHGTLFHDAVFTPFFCGCAGTGQFWHWEQTYVDRFNLYWHYKRFNTAIHGIDPAAEHFIPTRLPHPKCKVYSLVGINTTLIWCRSSLTDYRTELIDEKSPEMLHGETLLLPEEIAAMNNVTYYNPWTNKQQTGRVESKRITLSDFDRSLVVRLEK